MSLEIVIPAHNEERRIDRTLSTYRMVFADPSVRFIVAMDGCCDRTASVVAAHAAEDARVQSRVYPKLGKGGVLMEAFRCCDADWVAFVDADGATPPRELSRLLDAAMRADGAIASRRHPASFTPAPRDRGPPADELGVRDRGPPPVQAALCGHAVRGQGASRPRAQAGTAVPVVAGLSHRRRPARGRPVGWGCGSRRCRRSGSTRRVRRSAPVETASTCCCRRCGSGCTCASFLSLPRPRRPSSR